MNTAVAVMGLSTSDLKTEGVKDPSLMTEARFSNKKSIKGDDAAPSSWLEELEKAGAQFKEDAEAQLKAAEKKNVIDDASSDDASDRDDGPQVHKDPCCEFLKYIPAK